MYNLIELVGKKILIVGSSQGIGAQVALTLSKLGAQVILASRNKEKMIKILSNLEGNNHLYYCMDVRQLETLEKSVKEIVDMTGPLDGVVYCAGIVENRPLQMDNPSIVDEVFRTNLQGFIEIVRCVSKKKNFNNGMRIVGISSISSFKGTKARTIYSASKAGMDGAVRSMAVELAEKNICINTVAPAFIKTSMYEKTLENAGKEILENKLRRQYLGLGYPEDVANAVAFLISPAARLITGICLPVDGGFLTH